MPTILLNLLKSYGLYLAIAVAASGWFLWHDHLEIVKGRDQVIAQLKADNAKLAAHNAQVETDAKARTDKLQKSLDESLLTPIPTPRVVVRMCDATPQGGGTAGPSGSTGPQSDGTKGSSKVVGGPDIAPATEQILKDDGAIIEYLQGYIASCQKAGVCKQ